MSTSARRWSPWTAPLPPKVPAHVTASDLEHVLDAPVLPRTHEVHMIYGEPCQCEERLSAAFLARQVCVVKGGRALYISPY